MCETAEALRAAPAHPRPNNLAATPITGYPDTREQVFGNRYASVALVPSQYGPFTTYTSGAGRGAGVLVVRDGAVLLVRQARPAVGLNVWEMPRGGCAHGESFATAAARELCEEAGLDIAEGDLRPLGQVLPDTGCLTTVVGLFLADANGHEAVVGDEVDAVAWVHADDLVNACISGVITDSFTCVAVLRARLLGLI